MLNFFIIILYKFLRTKNVNTFFQEQQQKQLQLILAIAKAQRTIDGKQDPISEESNSSAKTSAANKTKVKKPKMQSEAVPGGGNDKA